MLFIGDCVVWFLFPGVWVFVFLVCLDDVLVGVWHCLLILGAVSIWAFAVLLSCGLWWIVLVIDCG